MNDNQPEQPEKERVLEHLPYLNLLLLGIRDIDNAIRSGQTGQDEADNLLSNLKPEWMIEIHSDVETAVKNYNFKIDGLPTRMGRYKNIIIEDAMSDLHKAQKEYARHIKKLVIKILSDKDMLLLTATKASECEYSVYQEND